MKSFFSRHMGLCALLLSLSLLIGCAPPPVAGRPSSSTEHNATGSLADFDSFLERFFLAEVTSNTINLHFTLSAPEKYGISETPITLGDISAEAMQQSRAAMENTLSALKGFDREILPKDRQLTYDILSDYLRTGLSISKLALYDEILRPSTGIQSQLPVLYEEYRFYDQTDVEDYLKLITLTDNYFSQIIDFEQRKAKAGLFMADYACDTIIAQCETFIKNPDTHYLILTFNNKIDKVAGLTDEERALYKSKNEALVKEHILPSYEKLAAALTALLGSGKNDKGLCYFPDGKKYYEYLVYHNTGSAKNISKIQKQIAAQRTSDLTQASALTRENPDLEQNMRAVSLPEKAPADTLNILRHEMQRDFPAAPDAEFTVSYIDACMEQYMAPAFYITAPIDDYKKNSIFINASTDASSMRYFTTLAHEGFPGHLYQTVMSYEAGLAPIRQVLNFPGYVEGWATYVEMISYQYAGLPENAAELMSLNQSALLSLYATTDLGIHYDGWSFGDTLAFWSDYGITDQMALREVYELIVEEPGHYLKYYVGYLEFLELKEKARDTYGSRYSDIAFHKAILDIGPAPFAILEKYLDHYYRAAE
ncbi:MAG: DUF885 domain-containing protein [Roseburia sp.]